MGQIASISEIGLTSFDEFDLGYDDSSKIDKILRQLTVTSDVADIVAKWERATSKRTKTLLRRWSLVGCAIRKLEEWGKFKLMMSFSVYQVELGHNIADQSEMNELLESMDLNGKTILADSYLNLSRANFVLSQYKKSIEYSRKSLEAIKCIRARNIRTTRLCGYCYLYIGKASLGLSNYKDVLENVERSLKISKHHRDYNLECLACCVMSTLYLEIKDYEKAIFFPLKASDLLQEHGKNWNKKFFTTVQLRLAESYRKMGKLDEAMCTAEDAMRSAISCQDRSSQAYCMLCFADIHRVRKDTERAIPRYDAAAGIMTEIGDQNGHAIAALGKAKAYFKVKDVPNSLAQYETALNIGKRIENKMLCLRACGEMTLVYERLANQEIAKNCTLHYHQLLEEMDLFCGICGKPIGEKTDQLEALSCFHLFHLRCVSAQGLQLLGQLACPVCRKAVIKKDSL